MTTSMFKESEATRNDALLAATVELRREVEDLRARRDGLERELQALRAQIGPMAPLGVLHDVETLMRAITGHGRILLKRLDAGDGLRSSAEAIVRAAESGGERAHRALAEARPEQPAPAAVSLNVIVAAVAGLLRGALAQGIELVARLDPGLGQVRADPTQIEHALVSLAVNAQDAMPCGGRLTVETANVDADGAGGWITLTVSDTGAGMDPRMQAQLFEPFFTRKTGRGTGLGLATVREIVERHGGHVTVSSAIGHGSSFTVYLPRLREAGVIDDEEEGARRGETILVVDDEQDVRELVREILELHGYRVLVAARTDEALTTAANHSGPIHLVITDVVLPGPFSVRQLDQRLGRLHPGIRILYMSGHAEHEIVRHIGGPSPWLMRKPFAVGALADMVRAALAAPPGPPAS
jgi:two-component system, cell cycle sensor histidine kinase and response regulator CckA